MKPIPLLLSLSVVLNAAFLLAYAQFSTRPPNAAPAAAATVPSSTTSAIAPNPITESPKAKPLWQRLDTSNLDDLLNRLKAAGFSRQEIRWIMMQTIQQRFAEPQATEPVPYWRSNRPNYSDPEVRKRAQARMVEQQTLMRKYVDGPEVLADEPEALDRARANYGNLPLAKLQALSAIEADYQEVIMKQQSQQTERGKEADFRAAYELLQKEKLADIAAQLTPEEFAEYELRGSPLAQSLHYRLETFLPTEDEYKTIFAIQKPYVEQLGASNLSNAERKALSDQLTAQITAALGADRAADYLEVAQNGSDETARLIARLELPARVTGQVRTLRDGLIQQANEIRANLQLSAADRTAQLTALAQQARTQLTSTLGARGYEAYVELKGAWIIALEKPTPGKP